MSKSSFERVLAQKGRLVYTNVGDSMKPLIKDRDLLVIVPVKRTLKTLDVPLYKRESGQYVLHRIIGKKDGAYVMCGDNRCQREYGITDKNVIGVLESIIRNGREVPVNNGKLRVYAVFWQFLYPIRYIYLRLRNKLRNRRKKSNEHK